MQHVISILCLCQLSRSLSKIQKVNTKIKNTMLFEVIKGASERLARCDQDGIGHSLYRSLQP